MFDNDKKELPIGIEDFKVLIDNNYYYVDKTKLLCELVRNIGKVNLFTRPRRFGKTLNMSMIRYFFERSEESQAYLFDGLDVAKSEEHSMAFQGQYPVISISLKSVDAPDFETAFAKFKELMTTEFKRHRELLKSTNLFEGDKKRFYQFCCGEGTYADYCASVKFLSECLYEEYGKKVIILIDEYDVPLEKSHFRGYYKDMIDFFRSVFDNALKTNTFMEMAVLTGCLRVSKESLFTGLNNPQINGILSGTFSDYFGFTETEVKKMTEYYKLDEKFTTIKEWYDGYLFGDTEIYNPWSVLNYLQDARTKRNAFAMPYWSNTSSNAIIHQLITESDEDTRDQIEELVNGGSVTAQIHEDMVYTDINVNKESIWSFLLFTGYLRPVSAGQQGNFVNYDLVIPNREVCSIYQKTILQWFNDVIRLNSRADLLSALLSQDTERVNQIIGTWLNETISFYDEKEQYYHGFLAGLLSGIKGYKLESNRESGDGRPDLILRQRGESGNAIVIEVKVADPKKSETLEAKLQGAFDQIGKNHYEEELRNDGYKNIILYGAAFRKKRCMIDVYKPL